MPSSLRYVSTMRVEERMTKQSGVLFIPIREALMLFCIVNQTTDIFVYHLYYDINASNYDWIILWSNG